MGYSYWLNHFGNVLKQLICLFLFARVSWLPSGGYDTPLYPQQCPRQPSLLITSLASTSPRQHCRLNICRYIGWLRSQDPNTTMPTTTFPSTYFISLYLPSFLSMQIVFSFSDIALFSFQLIISVFPFEWCRWSSPFQWMNIAYDNSAFSLLHKPSTSPLLFQCKQPPPFSVYADSLLPFGLWIVFSIFANE